MSFEAKYDGKCDACGDRIIPGEHVRYSDDDELVHSRCEESATTARGADVCGTCWLTKPCDCEAE